EERSDAENLDGGQLLFRSQRDRIRNHDLFERSITQAANGFAAQDAVGGTRVDFAGTIFFGDVDGSNHATGRGNHIVENHRHFVLKSAADQVRLFGFGGAAPAFIDN